MSSLLAYFFELRAEALRPQLFPVRPGTDRKYIRTAPKGKAVARQRQTLASDICQLSATSFPQLSAESVAGSSLLL